LSSSSRALRAEYWIEEDGGGGRREERMGFLVGMAAGDGSF